MRLGRTLKFKHAIYQHRDLSALFVPTRTLRPWRTLQRHLEAQVVRCTTSLDPEGVIVSAHPSTLILRIRVDRMSPVGKPPVTPAASCRDDPYGPAERVSPPNVSRLQQDAASAGNGPILPPCLYWLNGEDATLRTSLRSGRRRCQLRF